CPCAGIIAANGQDQLPFDRCWWCDATADSTSLRANGSAPPGRANARPMTGSAPPDDRLREAIQSRKERLDCFVALLLAMAVSSPFIPMRPLWGVPCRVLYDMHHVILTGSFHG